MIFLMFMRIETKMIGYVKNFHTGSFKVATSNESVVYKQGFFLFAMKRAVGSFIFISSDGHLAETINV